MTTQIYEMPMPIKNLNNQGFTLIQMSMIIAVSGIILASMLPAGDLGSDTEKERITKEKMQVIEDATQSFMAAKQRRPCPADGTLDLANVNFGKEAGSPGACSSANFTNEIMYGTGGPATTITRTGGTASTTSAVVSTLSGNTWDTWTTVVFPGVLQYIWPQGGSIFPGMLVTGNGIAANTHVASVDSATQITLDKYPTGAIDTLNFSSIVAGVVPVRALGLSDDYMFDGYGRRIGYMVDTRATDQTLCRDLQGGKGAGNVQILRSSSYNATSYDTVLEDAVMWGLISYGKDGHGAFPMQGSAIADRINTGILKFDESVNSFISWSDGTTKLSRNLVRHAPVTTAGSTYFDDLVWTHDKTKNNCCVGKFCAMGTRIDGSPATESMGYYTATGDINGDGIHDIITYTPQKNKIRVIFGRNSGWPLSAGMDLSANNSTRFITITNDIAYTNMFGAATFLYNTQIYEKSKMLAVGDLNGDGYDDIAMGNGNAGNSYVYIFYGSAAPVDTNTSAITNTITLPPTIFGDAPIIKMGNFSDFTHKDLLIGVNDMGSNATSTYVIYGKSSYSLTAESASTTANNPAQVGFKIQADAWTLPELLGSGDVNGDGYDDIIIAQNNSLQSFYVLFGETPANFDTDKTAAAGGSTPDIIDLGTRVAAGGTEAVLFTNGTSIDTGQYTMTVGEMNGDAYKDLIFNNGNYMYVYYGKAPGSWASVSLTTASTYDGTNGFRFNTETSRPSYLMTFRLNIASVADVNNDGKNDIIFVDRNARTNGSFSSEGVSFIAMQPAAGWSSIAGSGTVSIWNSIFNNLFTAPVGAPRNNDVSKGLMITGQANYGSQVTGVADINNDGKNDIIIGSSVAGSGAGKVYVLFGRTLVLWDPITSLNWLN